jgi:hypothetical protein
VSSSSGITTASVSPEGLPPRGLFADLSKEISVSLRTGGGVSLLGAKSSASASQAVCNNTYSVMLQKQQPSLDMRSKLEQLRQLSLEGSSMFS